MDISGKAFLKLRKAILKAYSVADLARALKGGMDVELENISLANNKDELVDMVIDWVDKRDREAEFITTLRTFRPNSPDLFAFSQSYGLVATDKPRRQLEKMIKANNSFLDVNLWREKLSALEGQICRIEINGSPKGTGFLIGSSTVMTNYHVVESVIKGRRQPTDVVVRFDYKVFNDGVSQIENAGTMFRLDVEDWLIDSSPYSQIDLLKLDDKNGDPEPDELDFAVIRLAEAAADTPLGGIDGAPARGFVALPDYSAENDNDKVFDSKEDTLFILQHPKGKPLKLDFNEIDAKNGNGTRIRYLTNTEGGSSGSPCFDRNWQLVALHHSGDPARVAEFNEGIPMQAIVDLMSSDERDTFDDAFGEEEA